MDMRVNSSKTKVMWYRVNSVQRILENIHVVFVGRELVAIQSCAVSVLVGLIKDVVASPLQEMFGEMPSWISIDSGVSWTQCKFGLERIPKFYYLGQILGAGGGVEEAARVRMRCAWAKLILKARGASYHFVLGMTLNSSVVSWVRR